MLAAYNQTDTATAAVDARFARLAEERVRAHPFRYDVVLPAARLTNMWFRPRTELLKLPLDWWRLRAHPWGLLAAIGLAALNLAYVLMAVAGWLRWKRSRWYGQAALAWSMVGFVVLRSAMLLSIDNSEPRYTLECFPVLVLLAGLVFGAGNGDSLRE